MLAHYVNNLIYVFCFNCTKLHLNTYNIIFLQTILTWYCRNKKKNERLYSLNSFESAIFTTKLSIQNQNQYFINLKKKC